jgi:hypothetical protein
MYFGELAHWRFETNIFSANLKEQSHKIDICLYKMEKYVPSVLLDQVFNSYVLAFCKNCVNHQRAFRKYFSKIVDLVRVARYFME